MKRLSLVWLLLSVFLFVGPLHASQKPLPKEVFFVAEKAEDVIDFFLKRDWKNARAIVDSISAHEGDIVHAMKENKMPPSALDTFNYFVFRLKELSREETQPVNASLAANQITALLIDLQRYYPHATPLEIARMDYLGREIVLLAQIHDDYGLRATRVSQLKQEWDDFRPVVLEMHGEKIASQVDHVLVDLQERIPLSQMVTGGNRLLDLVDELEALYK